MRRTGSISVCIIAKNEEANLPRALEALSDLEKELIVVDTGSVDRTVEIARSYGAVVREFPWCNDFSAAYNYAINHASGEWVFQIDADELLVSGQKRLLTKLVENPEAIGYWVQRKDFDANGLYTRMLHLRLFRNRADLRFIGRIHHRFQTPIEVIAAREHLKVEVSQLELDHFGYVDRKSTSKLERAEFLMELELRDRPGQFYYLVELGRTKLKLGKAEGVNLFFDAAHILKSDFKECSRFPSSVCAFVEHLLACDTLPEKFPLNQSEIESYANRYPRSVPLLWQRALKCFKKKCFKQCAELLESIISLGESEQYHQFSSFDPMIFKDAVMNLGVCLTRMGQLSRAVGCFEELLKDQKYAVGAAMNLKAIKSLDHEE